MHDTAGDIITICVLYIVLGSHSNVKVTAFIIMFLVYLVEAGLLK